MDSFGGTILRHVEIGGTDLKVAILDDTKSDAQILVKYIEKFHGPPAARHFPAFQYPER